MLHACFRGDTPILMADMTYKPIQFISEGDLVVSHTGNPQPVTSTGFRVEKVVTVKVSKLPPLIVTLDHPFLTEDGWVKVRDLIPRKSFVKVGKPNTHLLNKTEYIYIDNTCKQPYHTKKIPNKIKIDNDLMWLLGMYIAEGSVTNGYDLRFALNLDETAFAERIKSTILEKFDMTCYIRSGHTKAGRCTIVRVGSTLLSKWLIEHFGCGFSKKRVPEWCFALTPELIVSFLKGISDGDGCKINYKQVKITLSNEYLCRQLFDLLRLIGVRASIGIESTRPLESTPSWRVAYGETYNPGLDQGDYLRVESISDNGDTCDVYNLEVKRITPILLTIFVFTTVSSYHWRTTLVLSLTLFVTWLLSLRQVGE